MTNQQIQLKLNSLYKWFNEISDINNPFGIENLEEYFAPDFIMDLNYNIITNNYKSLFDHFNKFRKPEYILKV